MKISARFAPALAALIVGLVCMAKVGAAADEAAEPGKLHVAVYRDYAPFADEGQGIDVDVAKALAGRIGRTAVVKGYPDADSIDGDLRNIIWKGHPLWRERLADVMMHVPVEQAVISKNEQVKIFAPYFRERIVVARNTKRIPELPTLQIFTTEKIGVQVETLEDRYLMDSFAGLLRENVVHFATVADATAALRKGEVAAVMGRQTLIEAGLEGQGGNYVISTAPAPGLAITGWELGLAVKADNPELAAALDKAMAELLKDGSIERIFTKRGLSYRPPSGADPGDGRHVTERTEGIPGIAGAAATRTASPLPNSR
jgi:polar amino acid transport system substrate-binding protein